MKLDRALIKSQAKEIIRGKVFRLFLIIFVVGILTGAVLSVTSVVSTFNNMDTITNGDYYSAPMNVSYSFGSGFGGLVSLLLAPLAVTLAGLFLLTVKGTNFELADEFTYVFKNTFDKNYLQKFLMVLLRSIFICLWSILFFIPGIIYYYKTYFAAYIMADNPEIDWKQALDLSKKMTNGHKGELFALDLSFIPWYLLMGVTMGIAGIYVTPYIMTTQALFYENFKQRGLQTGELSEADFISNAAKFSATYGTPEGYQQNAYQPNPNLYQTPQPVQPNYQAPVQPQYQPYQAPEQPTYQASTEPTHQPYQPPVQPEYQPPQTVEQPPVDENYQ